MHRLSTLIRAFMNISDLSTRIDSIVAHPEATSAEVHRLASESMRRGLAMMCVMPVWTGRLATMLRGSGVRVGSLVSFPFGGSKSTLKAIEATSTIKEGADEIEIVAHLPYVIAGDLDGARAELMEVVRAARSTRRDVVIHASYDVALLMRAAPDRAERTIEFACRATRESGCDGIVAYNATADRIAAVKKFGDSLTIKAAIIQRPAEASEAIAAGADRIAVADPATILDS
jgi:deoxyribose-phosphate aldolase